MKEIPTERPAVLDETVKESYASGLRAWLAARKSRWDYLVPVDASDPRFKRIDQLTHWLVRMLPPRGRVVDLGFGPEGRDMADVLALGQGKEIEVYGIELVPENVASTMGNPRFQRAEGNLLAGKTLTADITKGIPYKEGWADAVILSSVIQHIEMHEFYEKVLPDVARVLKPNGILLLVFKCTEGEERQITINDVTMGGKQRQFYLYNPARLVREAEKHGLQLYPGNERTVGGVLRWKDQNRDIAYAGMYLIKKLPSSTHSE